MVMNEMLEPDGEIIELAAADDAKNSWKNALLTSRLWQAYTGYDIQPEQVPVMLALLKIARSVGARQQESSGKDNFVDACGYLHLPLAR